MQLHHRPPTSSASSRNTFTSSSYFFHPPCSGRIRHLSSLPHPHCSSMCSQSVPSFSIHQGSHSSLLSTRRSGAVCASFHKDQMVQHAFVGHSIFVAPFAHLFRCPAYVIQPCLRPTSFDQDLPSHIDMLARPTKIRCFNSSHSYIWSSQLAGVLNITNVLRHLPHPYIFCSKKALSYMPD